ncbi:MAG: putative Diguanylate cyclase/phosphodiesterase with domain [Myxococcaceae bacterium]|nr:putative Diguanylate cyclase/phosphodiesterase with domain [Myxococcaceae bacterium]
MATRGWGLGGVGGTCAGAAYALLLAACPARVQLPLVSCSLALPVLMALRGGARAGVLAGGALGALHVVLWQTGSLQLRSPHALQTFAVGQLLLLAAGYAVGRLSERWHGQLALERQRSERYELAARGSDDGLWDWDLDKKQVFRSQKWRSIAQPETSTEGNVEQLVSPLDDDLTPLELLTRVHPEDVADARAQLEAHLRGESDRYEHAHRIQHRDGTWHWVLERGLATRDAAGTPHRMAGFLTDIGLHKQSEERLRHRAFHDALTGLPNRALFMDRVQHAVARARRHPSTWFALLMLDLDRFKNVNDSLGHVAGDRLLNLVAARIGACVRDGDTVARLGGDEFAVLLEELRDEHEVERKAEEIQRVLAAPIPLDGHDLVTSASIGIVIARDDAFDALSLLRRADQAMYAAKKSGRGRQVVFEPSAHSNSSLRLTLETSLRTALSEGQLRVYFQPIVDVASGEATGFEALVRWPHPKLGLISPAELVPVAEESGAIVQLGDFVLQEALRALHRLEAAFRPSAPFTMAVNLSARELSREDLVSRVERALEHAQVAPSQLVLEVKESALMGDSDRGQAAFRVLREKGVRVHMDDFGTGYSSLSYLHKFPVDALKIDGSFTGRLHDNLGAEEIVRTVITIARDLHLGVIAEGVENHEQLVRLRALGCHQAQGFLFGAPLPLEALEALLRRGPKLAVA